VESALAVRLLSLLAERALVATETSVVVVALHVIVPITPVICIVRLSS
jgi:hypothetical protein